MKSNDRTALVDVKYSSLNHADATWRPPCKRPEMIALFKKKKFPILHLRRRNLVRLAFSLARAVHSKQYVARQDHDVSDVSISLDIRSFKRSLRELKMNDRMICQWLGQIGPKTLELTYEDLFEEHPGSPFRIEPFEKIAHFFGFDQMKFDLVPKTRKLAPQDLRKEIKNYDELEKALTGTPFEEFLTSS